MVFFVEAQEDCQQPRPFPKPKRDAFYLPALKLFENLGLFGDSPHSSRVSRPLRPEILPGVDDDHLHGSFA